jgi:hypothetical protein
MTEYDDKNFKSHNVQVDEPIEVSSYNDFQHLTYPV